MAQPLYNQIGINYNNTRKADPYIVGRIEEHLQADKQGKYLDIGCGTGNYLQFLSHKGYEFYGLDPSETMLAVARQQCPTSLIQQGFAEQIPFDADFFSGAMALFTFHHWENQQQGLNELFRVLKLGSRLVFLSFTAEQMQGYWLNHYFPKMIEKSALLIPTQESMIQMLQSAGFGDVKTEKYFVQADLQDHFLYSNKYKPEQYLNPDIRKGISSFSAFANIEEVEKGLQALAKDIESGKILEIISQFENDKGDYLFYIAEK